MNLNCKYLIISLFLFACTTESKEELEEVEAGTISMLLDAKMQKNSDTEFIGGQKSATRSTDITASEELISNLQIFFFDDLTGDLIWKPQTTDLYLHTSGLLKLSIPSLDIRHNISHSKVKIYVVANTRPIDVLNENDLLRQRVEDSRFIEGKQPTDFVMVGSRSIQIKFVGNSSDIGSIALSRLVSKIESVYPRIPSEGIVVINSMGDRINYFLDGDDAVGVCFYGVNTSSLLGTSNMAGEQTDISNMTEYHSIHKNSSTHFYSYSHSWSSNDEGAYLVYRLKLKRSDNSESKYYYYKVPITSNLALGASQESSLQANHHYFIIPCIETLGSTEAEYPVWANSQFIILDWKIKNLESSIVEAHYFMIEEYDVKMPNINQYRVRFASSSQVKFKGVSDAWYWGWEKINSRSEDLRAVKRKLRSNSSSYPRVEVVNFGKEKEIIISAEVPDDFSPHYFTLAFEDQNGLKESINIEHYPARYVTGERSEEVDKDPFVYYAHDMGYNTSLESQNNFNLFTITTLAGGEEFNGRRYRIGDPSYRKNGKVYTYEDYEHNQLVSPRFMIASQRSIYYRTMYNRSYYSNQQGRTVMSARERCANYAEGGYPIGTWRLPTEAELEYISSIQNSKESPVKSLLDGLMYWSGASYRYYIFKNENSYYDGPEGFFGTYTKADSNFQNDSYYILPNKSHVYVSNNPSAPHFEAFVDPSGIYDRRSLSSKFYYSSFVRCVRDI